MGVVCSVEINHLTSFNLVRSVRPLRSGVETIKTLPGNISVSQSITGSFLEILSLCHNDANEKILHTFIVLVSLRLIYSISEF